MVIGTALRFISIFKLDTANLGAQLGAYFFIRFSVPFIHAVSWLYSIVLVPLSVSPGHKKSGKPASSPDG